MQYTFEQVYQARHPNVDPDKCGQELAQLAANSTDGKFTHTQVLEYATKRGRAVRHAFTWNDTLAARKQRNREARELITAMRIKRRGKVVHAFVNLEGLKGYYTFDGVMADAELRSTHLASALRTLTSLQTRYKHLTELAKVFAAADKVKRDLQKQSA